jgi:hypothetical protein
MCQDNAALQNRVRAGALHARWQPLVGAPTVCRGPILDHLVKPDGEEERLLTRRLAQLLKRLHSLVCNHPIRHRVVRCVYARVGVDGRHLASGSHWKRARPFLVARAVVDGPERDAGSVVVRKLPCLCTLSHCGTVTDIGVKHLAHARRGVPRVTKDLRERLPHGVRRRRCEWAAAVLEHPCRIGSARCEKRRTGYPTRGGLTKRLRKRGPPRREPIDIGHLDLVVAKRCARWPQVCTVVQPQWARVR